MIREFVKKVQEGKIDVVKNTLAALEEIKRIDKENGYFNVISEELALSQAKSLAKIKDKNRLKLAGVIISVKDCICVKGVETRAGSRILNGYTPVFDANVIQRIREQGGIIVGKTSQDEFGFGSFSTNVGLGFRIPLNPHDKTRVCGGSSGGSAGIVANASMLHLSVAESTGGSIACPASFCGVVGLTPTYSRVSRHGLLDYANSLDKIGTMAKSVEDASYLLEVISGFDANDSTSSDRPALINESLTKDCSDMTVGVVKECFEGVDKEIVSIIHKKIDYLKQLGVKIKEISLPITMKYSLSAYYLIVTSEASTNLAKYCGMRYGVCGKLGASFNDYFSMVRSENLGLEAKRRIMLGTFARMAGFRDAYYIKALKVRTKIIEEYKQAFKECDAVITPVMPFIAPKITEVEKLSPIQSYMADILTVGPNLAGLPHISVNAGFFNNMPVGMMIIGDHFMEKNIIKIGSLIEIGQQKEEGKRE
jgi:aspartyl-tRNA(Asn)/glutamyl-tRNA(Gln) amidotransferase subunit A